MAEPDFTAAELRSRVIVAKAKYTKALLAPNTQRGYRFDWRAFCGWCTTLGVDSLPASADTIYLHVDGMLSRGLKVTTAKRRVAAVKYMHAAAEPNPVNHEIRDLLRGARRLKTEQVRKVRPLTIENLRAISRMLALDETPVALRNRAAVVVGFASALRCASLSALLLEDAIFCQEGLILRIRKSKTDQEGRGMLIGIPHGKHLETCAVRCLQDWLVHRGGLAPGPLFTRLKPGRASTGMDVPLQPERFGQIVQQCVRRIGLPWREYGGHSMRAGFITEAGEANISDWLIAAQSGHSDMATLREYFRRRDVFKANSCSMMDL
jgi:integrase